MQITSPIAVSPKNFFQLIVNRCLYFPTIRSTTIFCGSGFCGKYFTSKIKLRPKLPLPLILKIHDFFETSYNIKSILNLHRNNLLKLTANSMFSFLYGDATIEWANHVSATIGRNSLCRYASRRFKIISVARICFFKSNMYLLSSCSLDSINSSCFLSFSIICCNSSTMLASRFFIAVFSYIPSCQDQGDRRQGLLAHVHP